MPLINEQSMKLYTASEDWGLTYTKAELPEELGNANLVLLDNLGYLATKPDFGEIQTAFFRFSHIASDSKLWESDWLVGADFRNRYGDVILVYSHWDFYTLRDAMGDADELEILLFQTTCFGSIDISGSNTEEEIKTSCGTYKFARNDSSYTANIAGYFEQIDQKNEETLFTSLLLKTKFSTLKETEKGTKVFEDASQRVFWFMPFLMSQKSSSGYEGYALFKGTVNQAGLKLSTESAVQQFGAPISVQSTPIVILRDYPLKQLLGKSDGKPEKPVDPPEDGETDGESQ